MPRHKGIFIAATGQNVGKTTICLALTAALKKRYGNIGYIKPVGQQHVSIDGINVDKDVVLIKQHFQLSASWEEMSPVIIPQGFTRKYLDGEISEEILLAKIRLAAQIVASKRDFILIEGTGHVGVGSIMNLSNARVAKELGLDIVIIASGGLGSSFDELILNLTLCEKNGVPIRGVILNKVRPEKMKMITTYFQKALDSFSIPILGCVPYDAFLSKPTMEDFEGLFCTMLISGKRHRMRHFEHVRLMAGSVDAYFEEIYPNQLIITPACRTDIIEATLTRHIEVKNTSGIDFSGGMILTGRHPPTTALLDQFTKVDIPILYAPICSYAAMQMITSFTAKIRLDDLEKINKAIDLVDAHVDMEKLTSPQSQSMACLAATSS
jgi:phosphate acetyltransferase